MNSKKLGIIISSAVLLLVLIIVIPACKNCKKQEQAECEHNYGEWVMELYPTYSEWGGGYRICSKCNKKDEESIPPYMLNHYTIKILREPTCTQKGVAEYSFGSAIFTLDVDVVPHPYAYVEGSEQPDKDKFVCECGEVSYADHYYINGGCHYCAKIQPLKIEYVDANGDTSSIDLLYGDNFVNQERQNSPTSYFLGWFDERDNLLDENTVIYQNTTVYAKWQTRHLISSAEDFMGIYDNPSYAYTLTCDIDMRGELLQPIPHFDGIIDGYDEQNDKNFVIKNFVLSSDATISNYGLFAVNNGTIKNITFKDCYFSGTIGWESGGALGTIVGLNKGDVYGVNLDNAVLSANIYKAIEDYQTLNFSVGLFVGKNTGKIQHSNINGKIFVTAESKARGTAWSDVKQYHYFYVGGACGYNLGELSEIYVQITGDLKTAATHTIHDQMHIYSYLGGAIGLNVGAVNHSYSVSTLTHATISPSHYSGYQDTACEYNLCGAFIGVNGESGNISECFSKGSVYGFASNANNVGGFVGENCGTATVRSCYSYADVTVTAEASGVSLGGFAGVNSAVIQNSYSVGAVESQVYATIGGFIGNNASGGTIAKTYTTSSLTTKSGVAGIFAGVNSGTVSKSYYTSNIIFKQGSATQGNMSVATEVSEIAFNDLITESFLTNNLYWDTEGWYIGSDNNPFLTWEFEKIHNYAQPIVVLPDCENAGFTVYECLDCGLIFITDVVQPLGHDLSQEYQKESWIAPTHTTTGKQYYLCDHGTQSQVDAHVHEVIVDVLGHDEPQNVSCEQLLFDGTNYLYKCSCSQAGNEVYIPVDKSVISHTPQNVSYVAPVCGALNEQSGIWEGSMAGNRAGRICSVCNIVLYGCESIQPHSFDFTNAQVIQEASCMQEGILKVTCSLCQYECEYHEDLLEHSYVNSPLTCDACNQQRFVLDGSFVEISTVQELKNIIPNANYYLTCDIDLTNTPFTPLFSESDPFVGIFLSNGYKIKNLNLTAENQSVYYGGIFSAIGTEGKVVGLVVENVSITVTNVAKLKIGAIAGINNGEISSCSVVGNITFNLTAQITRNTVGVSSTSFDCVFGAITAENNADAKVIDCSTTANIDANYTIDTLLSPENVSNYFKDLINNTTLTNNVNLSLGAICGINKGLLLNSCFSASLNSTLDLSNKVSGISRGKAFTYFTLNEGAICGINSGEITSCSAKAKTSFIHTKEQGATISNNQISVLGVVLKQEYYKVIDNAVFEEQYLGLIANTTSSSIVNDLAVIN